MPTKLFSRSNYLTIEKRDDTQHLVEGYASSEDIDLQGGTWNGQPYEGDVIQASAIEKALPEYMEYANVHEMHRDDSAVGVILKAEVISGTVELDNGRKLTNPLHVIAHVVDADAWEKVITGVYKGFSIQADVFALKLAKVAGKVVRLIQSLRLTEISLVDRPANPGAKIILWKGANMAKQTVVQKAADPTKAVTMLQELRNTCELSGDLEKAGMYTNAIALAMQANGAEVEIIAEPDEEAEGEHAALGEEAPVEGEGEAVMDTPATEEEKTAALEGLNSEQSAEDEKPAEDKPEDKPEDDKEEDKKPEKKSLKAITHPIKKAAQLLDVVSKAEMAAISKKVEEVAATLTKRQDEANQAFAGDIARLAKALEDMDERVDALKSRPVLKEIPFHGTNDSAVVGQSVEIMKGLRDMAEDPQTRDFLTQKITQAEILAAKPNYVGFNR